MTLGLTALTRPFYRIAADLDTGSDASLCDAQRLKLLDGDFAAAAAIALEACEWLYQDTGDPRFVTELLDWVRKQEAVQPTFAWPYSMQYEYERPGAARTRALAMTEYLDPASPRITKASVGERAAAKAWLDEHPPFRVDKKD
jgi:hypothetical protein